MTLGDQLTHVLQLDSTKPGRLRRECAASPTALRPPLPSRGGVTRALLTDRPPQTDEEGTPPAPPGAHPGTHRSFCQRLALPLKTLRRGTPSTPRIL